MNRIQLFVAFFALSQGLVTAQTPQFNITDIGVVLGTNSVAQAINNPGSVVGYWSKGEAYAAFLYRSNFVYELTALGTNANFALSINDAGHVVGHSFTEDGYRAFYAENGDPLNLGNWGGTNSYGTSINTSNLVVGFSETTNGTTAVVYDGQPWNIGNLGGASTYPLGINDSNTIVGTATVASGEVHAFVVPDGGTITDLNSNFPMAGFTFSSAQAINGAGAIAGWGLTNGAERGFVFNGTNATVLPALASFTNSRANAINISGDVVGLTGGADDSHAFLWKNGTMYDLNDCVATGSGWLLRGGNGINTSGQVAGWGIKQGEVHAYLLTPNMPPTVSIISPANNTSIEAPADMVVYASASDDSFVTRVDFYVNDALVGTRSASPFNYTVTDTSVGSYALKAVAYDDLGAATTSAVVNVSVSLPKLASLRCWLKPEALVGTNGTEVSSWTDASGIGNSPTQGTSNRRPLLYTNQINGYSAVRFDGTNDVLDFPRTLATNNFTVFVVARPSAGHEIDAEGNVSGGGYGQKYLLSGSASGTNDAAAGLSLGTNGISAYEYQGGYTRPAHAVYAGAVGNKFRLSTLRYTDRLPDLFVDGFLVRNGYLSERVLIYSPRSIGDSSFDFAGDVAEVLFYSGSLSDAEVAAVHKYLNSRYAVFSQQSQISTITADALSSSEILVSWKQALSNIVTSCTIQRKQPGTEFTQIATVVQDTKLFDKGLLPNTTYTYRVKLGSPLSTNSWAGEASACTLAGSTATFPTTNVMIWLRAQDATVDANSKIGYWPDFLRSTNAAVQTNANFQPSLSTNANGLPQVSFAGGTSLNLPTTATNATQGEIIAVIQAASTSASTNRGLWKFGVGYTYYPATNGVIWDSFGSTSNHLTIAPIPSITNDCIYSAATTAGNWTARLNGETKHLATNNTVKFSGVPVLGVGSNGVSQPFQGNIKELLVFNRPLSTSEYTTVRDALAQKYSVQLSQPILPENLTVTNNSQWQNTLTWTALTGSQNGLESYFLIERKAVGNDGFVPAAILPRTASSYVDTNVLPQLAYAYRFRAINDVGITLTGDLISMVDTDSDGLSDYLEIVLGTNPLNSDFDGDGLPDGWEVKYGLNPLSATGMDGALGDPDGDGISNLSEFQNSLNPAESSSPNIEVHRPN